MKLEQGATIIYVLSASVGAACVASRYNSVHGEMNNGAVLDKYTEMHLSAILFPL